MERYEYLLNGMTERDGEIHEVLLGKIQMLERELKYSKQRILLDCMIDMAENLISIEKLSNKEIADVTGLKENDIERLSS